MRYYVTTQGRNNTTLFLIDRSFNKNKWWTTSLLDAMAFKKESAAKYSARNLVYKNPEVLNYNEAKILENRNDYNSSMTEHPFSSDALGQY